MRLAAAATELAANPVLAEAALRWGDSGVAVFWSALRHHGLSGGEIGPEYIAVANGRNAHVPSELDGLLHVVRWSQPLLFEIGVEEVQVMPGLTMKMTDPARTVLDCYGPLRLARSAGLGIDVNVATHALGQLLRSSPNAASRLFTMASRLGPSWVARIEAPLRAAQQVIDNSETLQWRR